MFQVKINGHRLMTDKWNMKLIIWKFCQYFSQLEESLKLKQVYCIYEIIKLLIDALHLSVENLKNSLQEATK